MTVTAINYAKALFASNAKREEIYEAYEIYKQNPVLVEILKNPSIKAEKKLNAVKRIFDKSVWGFFRLLIENGRIELFPLIIKYYREISTEEAHVMKAKVFYVIEPDENRKQKIANFLKKRYNVQKVSVRYEKDETLIGGFIIKVGDYVYDMSFKNKLKNLKENL